MLHYYPSKNDTWTVVDGNRTVTVATEAQARWYALTRETLSPDDAALAWEARMAKIDTARAIVGAVQSLATATDSAPDLEAEYFDVGSWADEDVAALGITASDVASCITLLQQVQALMSGAATTPAVYRATINKVRRV